MSHRPIKKYAVPAVFLALVAGGCVNEYQPRKTVQAPPLELGWSRVYISPGFMANTGLAGGAQRLWMTTQTGPVFINNQYVEATALDEYFIVDVKPGVHQLHCATSHQPLANYSEKLKFILKDGETRYLECDMAELGGTYATKTYFRERPPATPDRRLIAYHKLN